MLHHCVWKSFKKSHFTTIAELNHQVAELSADDYWSLYAEKIFFLGVKIQKEHFLVIFKHCGFCIRCCTTYSYKRRKSTICVFRDLECQENVMYISACDMYPFLYFQMSLVPRRCNMAMEPKNLLRLPALTVLWSLHYYFWVTTLTLLHHCKIHHIIVLFI